MFRYPSASQGPLAIILALQFVKLVKERESETPGARICNWQIKILQIVQLGVATYGTG